MGFIFFNRRFADYIKGIYLFTDFFAIEISTNSPAAQRQFAVLAQALLNPEHPVFARLKFCDSAPCGSDSCEPAVQRSVTYGSNPCTPPSRPKPLSL